MPQPFPSRESNGTEPSESSAASIRDPEPDYRSSWSLQSSTIDRFQIMCLTARPSHERLAHTVQLERLQTLGRHGPERASDLMHVLFLDLRPAVLT